MTTTNTSLTNILDAVDSMMTKVQSIASLPGVNLIPYVSTAASVIGAVHAAYTAGKAVEPYVTAIKNTFSGDQPSQADLDALNAQIAQLEAQVEQPLPAPDEGEPA